LAQSISLIADLVVCPSFILGVVGHFKKIDIAALLSLLKPRHVEKFRKCRLTDVGKSAEKKMNKNTGKI